MLAAVLPGSALGGIKKAVDPIEPTAVYAEQNRNAAPDPMPPRMSTHDDDGGS